MASDATGALALETEAMRDFDRIYRENSVYVLSVLRRFGLSRQQSEDLTQEVFERMFLDLLSLSREQRHSQPIARSYLFRTAWKLAANHRRRHSVRHERASAAPPEVLVGPRAHDYVLAHEIARVLDAVGPHGLAVFAGFTVFDMTAGEIARELLLSERDVRRILEDARATLDRELKNR